VYIKSADYIIDGIKRKNGKEQKQKEQRKQAYNTGERKKRLRGMEGLTAIRRGGCSKLQVTSTTFWLKDFPLFNF
jgi:hypothetical protein